ncbi:MAG: CDP-glycerol glycerophosphotransferase family protein [Bacilli bacterium]|nr:CDP-glycerol glycerophosphotransferase family protein [Bacilli bacterium]
MKKLKENIKYIKIADILDIFLFLIILIPAMIYRLFNKIRKKEIWLLAERKDTASDNAYYFYIYLKENHPEINSYYAIDKKCKEYENVKKYGNIINFRSLKHWIYYLAADKNISSQKSGNPSNALFYVLHVKLNLFKNRYYLQHGLVKDDLKWLYYNDTKFNKFYCGAKQEYDYIKKYFGYPKNNLEYTGLARFDNLIDIKVNKKQILLIPTWRSYLTRETNALNKKVDFKKTDFFIYWQQLLNNKKLHNYLEKNNITAYFYPHYNMQKYINNYKNNCSNIIIVKSSKENIQKYLKESALMVTDYSSVFFDFAFMKKPIIFYQFDIDEYRQNQYQEGYFSYENGFGDVIKNTDDVVNKIIKYIDNNYKVEQKYIKRMDDFFQLRDKLNCQRIYESISGKNEK